MTNEQQRKPIFCLDKLKKHLYNTIWGIKQLLTIYDNGSEFKLHFRSLCDTYGIKRKPTSVKNPQANAILERIHGVLGNMLRTSKLNMAESAKASDIDVFLSDAAWAVRSTYHTVLKASPSAAIFGRDMLFDIPFIADWQKIGEHRQ